MEKGKVVQLQIKANLLKKILKETNPKETNP